MKKSKFTEAQIVFALRQAESGVSVDEVCRKLGISQATFFNWKKKFGGLGVSDLRKLRQLEEENAQLRKLVSDLSLDKQILQDVLKKSAIENYKISVRRACSLMMISSSVWYYIPTERSDELIKKRMREIAQVRVRYGFWRIFTLLRREGFADNHKRVYRIYCNEGLNLRSRRPRRSRCSAHRLHRIELLGINQSWSMDFVADQTFDGRKFRALTVVDNFSHKCLAIHAGQSLKGVDVVDVMNRIKRQRNALPVRIQVVNGSEFISKDLDKWAYENGVIFDYSRPGKPTDNPYIESFNGKFRDECLNIHWFMSLEDAQIKIDHWLHEYNSYRPHSSIDDLTPDEFEEAYEKQARNSTLELS